MTTTHTHTPTCAAFVLARTPAHPHGAGLDLQEIIKPDPEKVRVGGGGGGNNERKFMEQKIARN